MRLTESAACDLATRAFTRVGVRKCIARDAARMLTTAEMMGITTHGLARLPNYIERVRAGGVNALADPVITPVAPAVLQVDGQNGLGAAVALRAMRGAMQLARTTGFAAAFCRQSSHLGALAPVLWEAVQGGFAAIITTNTAPMIAPAGGRQPMLGNAPIGLAIPDPSGAPVLLDMALSVAARSKVRAAAVAGQSIPDTWALDAKGHATTDAAAAMQGMMQAVGGAKGANLSLSLDLFAGGLSGAAMLSEIPNANLYPGAVADVGHMILVFDPGCLMPSEDLSTRLADARQMVEGNPPATRDTAVRMPGARAVAALQKAQLEGFKIAPKLYEKLEENAG